ncbi:hypothetical protein [Streptomyces spectabilis]|uniref:Uncharacterized protein n=1 Tax=Streptomyces spectabilis TaxID=68270 RepID=A0A5P2X5S2_STRST|nr:hypothetical protein [Streptomyces spectabilis]MBB5103243.1 hypothetical protein [Streptomyces spectabilis]MCI3902435.1 hypothetical protein [Streptomyces spectabilis]QEV59781.1 hypothetical protein CP982_14410 [Streptomyces spectabilis]GGV13898.1 hypothetical protein GCM10010245_24210 [Streptomyces spectabilis]
MLLLPDLLTASAALGVATGATYATTLLTVVLVSVVSRNPTRRRDARATLTILVRRRPPR